MPNASLVGRWLVPLGLLWIGIVGPQRLFFATNTLTTSSLYHGLAVEQLGHGSGSSLDPLSILSIQHPDATTCARVNENVIKGIWPDPNQGSYFVRRVVEDPYFFVSVHSKAYDNVRYGSIFVNGRYYEKKVIDRFNYILSQAPKDSFVIDVGGNIGFYTLLSASHGQRVITFEINPANLIRMCESLSLNRWADNGRVFIYQRAVSNEAGQELQVVIPANPGGARLQPLEEGANTKEMETTIRSAVATTITLDGLALEQNWYAEYAKDGFSIPLLKMDVEGAEPQVIEGAKTLLASGIVKNALTELRNPDEPATRLARKILLDAGFRIVNDENDTGIRRLSLKETTEYLDAVEDRMRKKMIPYADLWFQLDQSS